MTFRVTSRWQNPKAGANIRKPANESESAKGLAIRELRGNQAIPLGFLDTALKTPTLSAIHSVDFPQ